MECVKPGAWNCRARVVVYREMLRPVLLTVTQSESGQDPVGMETGLPPGALCKVLSLPYW